MEVAAEVHGITLGCEELLGDRGLVLSERVGDGPEALLQLGVGVLGAPPANGSVGPGVRGSNRRSNGILERRRSGLSTPGAGLRMGSPLRELMAHGLDGLQREKY